jgi:hypothetical protein
LRPLLPIRQRYTFLRLVTFVGLVTITSVTAPASAAPEEARDYTSPYALTIHCNYYRYTPIHVYVPQFYINHISGTYAVTCNRNMAAFWMQARVYAYLTLKADSGLQGFGPSRFIELDAMAPCQPGTWITRGNDVSFAPPNHTPPATAGDDFSLTRTFPTCP